MPSPPRPTTGRTPLLAAVSGLLLAMPTLAFGQMQPQPTTPPGAQGPQESKPEGIAEQAPKVPGALPTTPVLRPPTAKKKKFRLFELNGYFRFRTDFFKNFHQGFLDDPTVGGAPFRRPLGCSSTTANAPCDEGLKSANMRLRLEPIINLDEKASVHFQVDLLDNLVLGSTPDGSTFDGSTSPPTNIPLEAFSGGQVAPQAGRNLNVDSVQVKRAWAEVMTPLGLVKFGRMPSHWGMGILANSGSENPFSGEYDLDADYGDTADRLIFGAPIPGTRIKVAVGTDWVSTAPSSAHSDIFRNRYDGQPWDLEDNDDVSQWIVALTRSDSPEEFQDLRDQGEVAVNYGIYFVYRQQDWDQRGVVVGNPAPADQFYPRGAEAYIFDGWGHLGYKKFEAEIETVAIIGSIDELTDVGLEAESYDIRQFGGVARINYKLVEDKLKLQLEVGYASGDQWDNSPQGVTNVRDARPLSGPGDYTLSDFKFDFDYKIDLILFRELLGTVTNATYIRPSLDYDITKRIHFNTQTVVSFANVPVATPGNGRVYGIEIDADFGYENEGFFAGIAGGFLIPFTAMDHPPDLGYPIENAGDADAAWTVQTRLALKF